MFEMIVSCHVKYINAKHEMVEGIANVTLTEDENGNLKIAKMEPVIQAGNKEK